MTVRSTDVSGTLSGDLGREVRGLAALATTDADAFIPYRPFARGPQAVDGYDFASDRDSGLGITRLVRGK